MRNQERARELAAQHPTGAVGQRFLVCKPMGGIGNWIAGLVSCAALAMATERSLLLARPPPTPAEKTTSYDLPVDSLFTFPIDMSLAVLGSDVSDIPFLTDEHGAARDEGHLQMVDLRSHDLLCVNLTSVFHRPLAVMPAHLWLGAITRNIVHRSYFQTNFGTDAFGVAPFAQFLGPWLLSPRPDILAMVHKLEESLLQKTALDAAAPLEGPVIGLQIRLGMQIDIGVLSDRPPAGSGPEFARCAYSFLPQALRNKPAGWVVTADNGDAKRDVLMLLAQTEGPITAASSEELL